MERYLITRLGHLGDGIAESAGGPVFATRCLPGEEIEGAIDGDRLVAPRIVKPSPDRVRPPCVHYTTCGGCALQHMSDAAVAEWKVQITSIALAAQGLEAPFRSISTSPPFSRRRATLAGKRTKKGALVGFHARASDTIADTRACHLITPKLTATRPALEAITLVGASRKAALSLTVTEMIEGCDVAVTGGKPLDLNLRQELGQIAGAHNLVRLSWDGEVLAQANRPTVRFADILVSPPPAAFLQATRQGEDALRAAVTEITEGAGRIADLFAGCGTFALPMSRQSEVHAVEGAADLTRALSEGWRQAQGLRRVTTETRDLFRRPLTPDALDRFDTVVLDPPRAGASAQVAQIAASQVQTLAMVSCNPVTFARDAKVLSDAGFRLDWVQVVDQFRWSPHVELAAKLTRNHMGA